MSYIPGRPRRRDRHRPRPGNHAARRMGAQITLIGVPGPMSIEAVLSAPNGGYGSSSGGRADHGA
jgi:hypothetical protein